MDYDILFLIRDFDRTYSPVVVLNIDQDSTITLILTCK